MKSHLKCLNEVTLHSKYQTKWQSCFAKTTIWSLNLFYWTYEAPKAFKIVLNLNTIYFYCNYSFFYFSMMKIQLISPLSWKSDLFQSYILLKKSFFFQIDTTCFNDIHTICTVSVAWAYNYFIRSLYITI